MKYTYHYNKYANELNIFENGWLIYTIHYVAEKEVDKTFNKFINKFL